MKWSEMDDIDYRASVGDCFYDEYKISRSFLSDQHCRWRSFTYKRRTEGHAEAG